MNRPWKQTLLTVPAWGVALLPKLACPLCWPAYAGLLSSVGLGFLISTKYLLPLTAAFLAVAVGALAFKAKSRHGYGPFMLGVLTLGHADPDFPPLSIFGITLMALASIPFAAGGVAARRSGPALAPAAQSLITIAVLAAAVAVAGLVAGRLG